MRRRERGGEERGREEGSGRFKGKNERREEERWEEGRKLTRHIPLSLEIIGHLYTKIT